MQELNDDMDDLFRRAAENYPLQTNSSDWDKVLSALLAAETTPAVNPTQTKKSDYRQVLWLLLLLPVWVCNKYTLPATEQKIISAKEIGVPATVQPKDNTAELKENNTVENPIVQTDQAITSSAITNQPRTTGMAQSFYRN